jgi:hypothetical protein
MLDDKDPETFLGKQWLTKNEDMSWMIEDKIAVVATIMF